MTLGALRRRLRSGRYRTRVGQEQVPQTLLATDRLNPRTAATAPSSTQDDPFLDAGEDAGPCDTANDSNTTAASSASAQRAAAAAALPARRSSHAQPRASWPADAAAIVTQAQELAALSLHSAHATAQRYRSEIEALQEQLAIRQQRTRWATLLASAALALGLAVSLLLGMRAASLRQEKLELARRLHQAHVQAGQLDEQLQQAQTLADLARDDLRFERERARRQAQREAMNR